MGGFGHGLGRRKTRWRIDQVPGLAIYVRPETGRLFRDVIGTLPTSVGQTVALALDGLADTGTYGSDLFDGAGSFAEGTAWDCTNFNRVPGGMEKTMSSAFGGIQRSVALTKGQLYLVEFDVETTTPNAASLIRIDTVNGTGVSTGNRYAPFSGKYRAIIAPADGNTAIKIVCNTTWTGRVSNFTLRAVNRNGAGLGPELVTNGSVEANSTGWTNLGVPTLVERSNQRAHDGTWSMRAIAPESTGMVSPAFPVVAGKTYLVSCWIYIAAGRVYVDRANGVWSVFGAAVLSTVGQWLRWERVVYTSTTGQERIKFYPSVGVGYDSEWFVDGLSVREIPGHHASKSVTASQPVLQVSPTGVRSLYFDGADDFMEFLSAKGVWRNVGAAWVVADVEFVSSANTYAALFSATIGGTSTNGRFSMYLVANSESKYSLIARTKDEDGMALVHGISNAGRQIVSVAQDYMGRMGRIWQNGVLAASVTAAQLGPTSDTDSCQVTLGHGGTQRAAFRLYALAAGTGVLSDADRQRIEAMFASETIS